jgi:hypothetical protein
MRKNNNKKLSSTNIIFHSKIKRNVKNYDLLSFETVELVLYLLDGDACLGSERPASVPIVPLLLLVFQGSSRWANTSPVSSSVLYIGGCEKSEETIFLWVLKYILEGRDSFVQYSLTL